MICVRECFDLLPSRSFIVSGLMFRSLIHFEFIFLYGIIKCSSFTLLQVVDQFSQHHLLKRLSLLHCIFLPPLSKIRCPYVCGCPSADEWIRKLWYIYTMEYYSAVKKNSFESVLMRWMKLELTIQSEVSQKEKHQYSILTHVYGI